MPLESPPESPNVLQAVIQLAKDAIAATKKPANFCLCSIPKKLNIGSNSDSIFGLGKCYNFWGGRCRYLQLRVCWDPARQKPILSHRLRSCKVKVLPATNLNNREATGRQQGDKGKRQETTGRHQGDSREATRSQRETTRRQQGNKGNTTGKQRETKRK